MDGDEIGLADLPARVRDGECADGAPGDSLHWKFETLPAALPDKPLIEARKEVVSAFEYRYLSDLLSATGGRVGEAAARASVNERSLYDMMKRCGLTKENFKQGVRRR